MRRIRALARRGSGSTIRERLFRLLLVLGPALLVDAGGRPVHHCHVPGHEDSGMMGVVESRSTA